MDYFALEYFGKKITYKELFANVDKAAAFLTSESIKSGDVIALLTSSCPEFVYLLLAANKIGAVANMINPLFEKKQIKGLINETGAKLLFVLDQLYGLISDSIEEIDVKRTVVMPITRSMPSITKVIAGAKLKKQIDYSDSVIKWDDAIKNVDISKVPRCNDAESPAIMVYSSGTTSVSKGIVLLNKGINATIAHYEFTDFEYDRKQSFLQIIPIWFSTGIVLCLLMPLAMGLRVVLEPVFSEANFTKDIMKYKPNMMLGATSQWLHFLNKLGNKKIDLSFVSYPITGGEKMLSETEDEINALLKRSGCTKRLITGYGMCELGATVTTTSPINYKGGTVGYPIKNAIVAAFNLDTNEECKYFERGEIRALTPARMLEYYKSPDATNSFFRKDSTGREWGCTGDVGYVDTDGFVFVEGRASDFFVSKSGKKNFCFDIENVILEKAFVSQCEVVGRDTHEGYEQPVAFVVLKENMSTREAIEDILKYCKEKLDTDLIPYDVRILDSFPVKGSGKRDMEKLKQMAAE